MQTRFLKKAALIVSISIVLLIALCAGNPVFAESGKTWVPISGNEKPGDGEPGLNILDSNQNGLDIEMRTMGFFVSDREAGRRVYNVLNIGKYNGDLPPGYPNLPTLRRYIYIPAGKTVRIEVKPGNPVSLDNYRVYPMQKPQTDTKDAVDPEFFVDDRVYKSDRLYPSQLAFIEKSRNIRGHSIALLHICPFQYNPPRKVLNVYPEMRVKIFFEGTSETIDSRLFSPHFDGFVQGFVLNPDAFSEYGGRGDHTTDTGAEFLIITPPDFSTAAYALHDHKETLGLDTIVVTTDETGTTNTEIRAYIQNAYDTWTTPPSYVLLLADTEFIPTNYESIHSYHGTYTGTDLYYSTVDGADYEPDIFMGRISVDSLSEAGMVVQKIIDYEGSPPAAASFYSNVVVAAYFQDYSDGYEDRRFVRTSEEVRDYMLTQGYDVQRVYCRTSGAPAPTNYNNGTYGSGEPLPEEMLISNGFAWDGDAADISSGIDNGAFLVLHRDHGMDRNDGYSHTGWGDPYFVETHVDALTNGNLLPIVLSFNCETGWFDGETDSNTSVSYESFCEHFLRNPGGGAVSVIGATRVSYSGHNDFFAEGMIDCAYPDFLPSVPNNSGAIPRLGPMMNHGKIAMDILWGDPWNVRKVEYEIFHVIGDPTLRMWQSQSGTQGTNTVRVQSSPELGIPVTVSQNDINGNGNGDTNFTRTYPHGTSVTLTAAAAFNGRDFLKWIVDGSDDFNPAVTLTMDSYHSAEVVYSEAYTLTVTSSPVAAIPITVSPDDNNGSGNGNTAFTRVYDSYTLVTLTAPAVYNGRDFVRWLVDGAPDTNPAIQVTMDNDHTVKAEYSILPEDTIILVIDLDPNTNSGPEMEAAITANGHICEYTTSMPQEINSQLYPAVFVCLGIYSTNHVLSTSEGTILKTYLDNGGRLYMEGGDTWAYDYSTSVHPYFGLQGISDGSADTGNVSGTAGTFTQGFSFTYEGENNWMDRLGVGVGVTDAYVIWNNLSPVYNNGVARNAGTYKTIGVSFEFGGIPDAQQDAVMEKYLTFLTTIEVPSLTVTAPNGGEALNLGIPYNITWTAFALSDTVKITLWKDGVFLGVIADSLDPASGSYSWMVGDYIGGTAAEGTGYSIKIKEKGTTVSDFSDGPFEITPPSSSGTIEVTAPNGGENPQLGKPFNITWNASDVNDTLKITLWKDGVVVGVIASELDPASGSFTWTVGEYDGGTAAPGTGYTVKIKEKGTTVSDFSDAPFTICSLKVASPNGGENWAPGSPQNIAWNAPNVNGPLKITLWKDGVLVGTIADGLAASSGSYQWTVGNYNGGIASAGPGYTVKIKEKGTTVSDFSDASFTIN